MVPPCSFVDSQIFFIFTHISFQLSINVFFLNLPFIGLTLTLPLSRQGRGEKKGSPSSLSRQGREERKGSPSPYLLPCLRPARRDFVQAGAKGEGSRRVSSREATRYYTAIFGFPLQNFRL
jgi:hypothetical protein